MRAYESLSSYDFECLIRDLLQEEWGERLESFSPGPDGGVDVRLLTANALRTVQCKHSPSKTLSQLKSSLAREAAKLSGKKFGEYWLATTATATPASKRSTSEVFAKQGLRDERILAREDLENLLTRHPRVERAHVKLYVSSLAVLEGVINHALFERQRYFLDRASARARLFVTSSATRRVQETLDRYGLCIVTGPPGVGKTTLAESIGLTYAADGYEVFDVRNASEIEGAWRPGERQIFLYDDFLGQTSLMEKLSRGEDHSLDVLARRLAESPSHRMILTTREYILTAAQSTYSKLRKADVLETKVVVDISAYSQFQRAHILLNHVYYSKLGKRARASLVSGSLYRAVIRHKNYNPRLIESVINAATAKGGIPAQSGFAKFMLETFENPDALWRDVFAVELTPAQRALAVMAGTGATSIERSKAVDCAERMLRGRGRVDLPVDRDIDVLEGIFLTSTHRPDGAIALGPKNPSIRDFLLGRLLESPRDLEIYLREAPESSIVAVLVMVSGSGRNASRPWRTLSGEDQYAALMMLRAALDEVLERIRDPDNVVRVVSALADAFSQRQSVLVTAIPSLRDTLSAAAKSATDIDALVAAFDRLEPLLDEKELEQLAQCVRTAWDNEYLDVSQFPAALDFERRQESGLDIELEGRMVGQIEVVLDNPSNYGYDSTFEMLSSMQNLMTYVSGDYSDLEDRIRGELEEVWEPDDDDDRGRGSWGQSGVSMDAEVDSLFQHL
ncbi:restriction endonuclease [Microbacterium sp. WCS2018Hpa-9]|uniref:nSTAND3 domain-containing NTPase n=1 Tax=Microbacterium sp. WCS2018Hpa-9 TaxID=3073635 RepID=UPI00288BACE5|nr:restriction endonuclease [Microbacterium sp. WCS2018Hpa-9]